jgi:hypothetical protein
MHAVATFDITLCDESGLVRGRHPVGVIDPGRPFAIL